MAVPRELGGGGLNLAEAGAETRRLAYYAPATALGTNMHVYWTGLAADLWRAGDRSLEWLLNDAVQGEVFNAGHSERGNDLPVLLSTCKAEKVRGGFRFTGRKMFGSLTQLSHYRAFGDMRLAEFRGNTARLSICGAKPVRTER
jgi:alkylation response protein AidB-like acyl-CoA dehydrogenase